MTSASAINAQEIVNKFLPHEASEGLNSHFKDKVSVFFEAPQMLSHRGEVWAVMLFPVIDDKNKVTDLFVRLHADKQLYIWKISPSANSIVFIDSFYSSRDTGWKEWKTPAFDDHSFIYQQDCKREDKSEYSLDATNFQLCDLLFAQVLADGKPVETDIPQVTQLDASRLKVWLPDIIKGESFYQMLIPPISGEENSRRSPT